MYIIKDNLIQDINKIIGTFHVHGVGWGRRWGQVGDGEMGRWGQTLNCELNSNVAMLSVNARNTRYLQCLAKLAPATRLNISDIN